MDKENKTTLEIYLKNIKYLYTSVKKWLSEKGFSAEEVEHTINEEQFGRYKTSRMIIHQSPKDIRLGELSPVSASVIGADGRVDLTGDYDHQILVYMTPNKPDGTVEKMPYKGVQQNGWYWSQLPLLNQRFRRGL